MRKRKNIFVIIIISLVFLSACADGNGQGEQSTAPPQNESSNVQSTPSPSPDENTLNTISGEVVISFDYERISGSASNQFALWVEDMDGNYINTIYATSWTA